MTGSSNETTMELWHSSQLQAAATLRATGQIWCADEAMKLYNQLHDWAKTTPEGDERLETKLVQRLIDFYYDMREKFRRANRKINQMQAVIDRQKQQMEKHGIVPCPYNCFEQEPGNGHFEVVSRCGWGVEQCPVCKGLGVVGVYSRNIFAAEHGDEEWFDRPRDNFLDD